jgi:hypothetical protein
MNGKYTIELCRPGGEDAGIERVFERQDDLAIARKLYTILANKHPDRLIMLCDRAVCWHAATSPTECRTDLEERHKKSLRVLAKLLRKDEARRIAANVAKLPER